MRSSRPGLPLPRVGGLPPGGCLLLFRSRFLGGGFRELLGALHVHAQHPGGASAHDRTDDRIPARVATLLGRVDEPTLGERVRVVAIWVPRASEEPFPAARVPDDQLALVALLAPPDDVL